MQEVSLPLIFSTLTSIVAKFNIQLTPCYHVLAYLNREVCILQIDNLVNTTNINQTHSLDSASQVNGNDAAHVKTDSSVESLMGHREGADSVAGTLNNKECKLETINERITYFVEMLKDCINEAFDKITGAAEYKLAPQALIDQSASFAERLETVNNKAEEIQNCIQTNFRIDKNEAHIGLQNTTKNFLKLMATGHTQPEHNLKAALGMAKMLAQTHGQSLSHDLSNANASLKEAFDGQLQNMRPDEKIDLMRAASSTNMEITKGAIAAFRQELIDTNADSWMSNRAENMLFVIENFELSVLGPTKSFIKDDQKPSDDMLGAAERAAMENIRNR